MVMQTMREKGSQVGKRIKKDVWEYKLPLLLFLLYYTLMKMIFHAYCPMVLLTGLPCAACGMTRAMRCLFMGEWQRAWNLQPFAALWLLFGAWIFLWRYLLGKRVKWFRPILLVLLISLFVFYLYRMATVFPSYPPMTYRYHNFLSNCFPFYRELLQRLWKI